MSQSATRRHIVAYVTAIGVLLLALIIGSLMLANGEFFLTSIPADQVNPAMPTVVDDR